MSLKWSPGCGCCGGYTPSECVVPAGVDTTADPSSFTTSFMNYVVYPYGIPDFGFGPEYELTTCEPYGDAVTYETTVSGYCFRWYVKYQKWYYYYTYIGDSPFGVDEEKYRNIVTWLRGITVADVTESEFESAVYAEIYQPNQDILPVGTGGTGGGSGIDINYLVEPVGGGISLTPTGKIATYGVINTTSTTSLTTWPDHTDYFVNTTGNSNYDYVETLTATCTPLTA